MENKLTWVELKKVVTRQTNLTEKEVNLILTTWLDEMVAALQRGEELHISGLGTFRMKTMKARKSVDVTTGEAIILPESERLTYTMASGLEEQLKDDAPVHLKAGTDPIQKLSEQADEILDIIGEIKAISPEGEKAKRQEGKKAKPERVAIPDYEIPIRKGQEGKKAKRREGEKKERLWLTALITIVAFVALLFGLFYFFQYKFEQWLQNLRMEAEMVEMVDSTRDIEAIDTIAAIGTIETIETPTLVNYREYTEFIAEEQMHQDSRLAWMAYRYYGNKKLWVFIYDANKDHIANPERISVGTPIRIPKLSQEILNYGEDIQALVQEMYDEFLKK